MRKRSATVLVAVALTTLVGCTAQTAAEPAPTTGLASPTASPTSSPTPKPTRTPPADRDGDGVPDISDAFPDDAARSVQLRYPSGDAVVDGYPVIVDTAQLDYRVANWIKTPQAVAIAPGLYVGYNAAVADLSKYLDSPADGDCVAQAAFGITGGACWNGVAPSPAEPGQ